MASLETALRSAAKADRLLTKARQERARARHQHGTRSEEHARWIRACIGFERASAEAWEKVTEIADGAT